MIRCILIVYIFQYIISYNKHLISQFTCVHLCYYLHAYLILSSPKIAFYFSFFPSRLLNAELQTPVAKKFAALCSNVLANLKCNKPLFACFCHFLYISRWKKMVKKEHNIHILRTMIVVHLIVRSSFIFSSSGFLCARVCAYNVNFNRGKNGHQPSHYLFFIQNFPYLLNRTVCS